MSILAYHATYGPDFERFEHTSDIGFHFGGIECANRRLEHIHEDEPELFEGSRILVCLLDIERPLRLYDCHLWESRNVMLALSSAGVLSEDRLAEMWGDGYLDPEAFRDIVEAAGYDSVVYENETEGGGDSYIVLRPEHIRFALCERPNIAMEPASAPRRAPRP